MKPENLITQKIVDYCKTQKMILILGKTKSGKVTIARQLAMETGFELNVADDFIEIYGYDHALNQFESRLEHCYHTNQPCIFEGILCYRLLRRLAKGGYYLPDFVIHVICNEETISHFYSLEEPNKNMNRVHSFNDGLSKIWLETLNIVYLQGKKLKVLELNTSIF